jgi:hypothetical protein
MDGPVYGYGLDVCELLRIQQSGSEVTRVRTYMWLRTPLGWKIKFVSGNCERGTWVYTVDGEDIRSWGLDQASDGLYAEVLLWCASEPIARRWIVPTCIWKLSDYKNGSDCHKRSCWKNPIGVSVPRPHWSDVYVCSKSCRLCLTVVYWLLECNKVPSWIEQPENVAVSKMSGVQILAWRPAVLSQIFSQFSVASRHMLGYHLKLGHDRILLLPLQFIIHYPSCKSTLCYIQVHVTCTMWYSLSSPWFYVAFFW